VRPDVPYFNIQMPKNNPGWRTKWFYAKDKSSAGEDFGLKEFRATTILRPRVSWRHELSDEEMKITEPRMEKIQQLRATPKKELSGIQLIRTFIERWVQPLAAQAHCMWDYSDRRDSTRISPDELHEAEIDDCVRAVTNIKKKAFVPKIFGAVAFSKAFPRTKVRSLSLAEYFLFIMNILIWIKSDERCLLRLSMWPGVIRPSPKTVNTQGTISSRPRKNRPPLLCHRHEHRRRRKKLLILSKIQKILMTLTSLLAMMTIA
jgi:hypothetical protein